MPTPPAIAEIYNYRQAAPDLAASGQPKENQLSAIADAGYEVVINLALHNDSRYSLLDETASVTALGMKYFHIPVQFDNPTEQDLLAFFNAMEQSQGHRVGAHCAANMRVTAFVALYRVLRQGWLEDEAFALVHEIWQPNKTWSEFIAT